MLLTIGDELFSSRSQIVERDFSFWIEVCAIIPGSFERMRSVSPSGWKLNGCCVIADGVLVSLPPLRRMFFPHWMGEIVLRICEAVTPCGVVVLQGLPRAKMREPPSWVTKLVRAVADLSGYQRSIPFPRMMMSYCRSCCCDCGIGISTGLPEPIPRGSSCSGWSGLEVGRGVVSEL